MASFKANNKGFRALRRSTDVLADLARRVQRMQESTGEPDLFVTDSAVGRNRARASLRSYGIEGAIYQRENHTLERSIDAGGDV